MLLPRYSLRTWLTLVSSCAVFFLILGQAYQQQPWAIVVTVAVVTLVVTLFFHGLTYLICAAFGRIITAQQSPARTSRGGVQSTPDQQAPPSSGNLLS